MMKRDSAISIRLKSPEPSTTLSGLKSLVINSTTVLVNSTAQVSLGQSDKIIQ